MRQQDCQHAPGLPPPLASCCAKFECFTVFVVLSAVHLERRQFEFALLLGAVCCFHSTRGPSLLHMCGVAAVL